MAEVDAWRQHEPVQLPDLPNRLAVVARTKGPVQNGLERDYQSRRTGANFVAPR